mgnify:CR=1 FL=1
MDYTVVFAGNGGSHPYAVGHELLGDFSAVNLPDAHRGRDQSSKRGGKQGTGQTIANAGGKKREGED